MRDSTIARNYAETLLELARRANDLDSLHQLGRKAIDEEGAVARRGHAQRVVEPVVDERLDLPVLERDATGKAGLLVGAAFTQRPDLFGAVVCQVPLLDMQRYHKLLAGASWMAEYGDPDVPEQWDYIRRYSPYQNVRAGQRYPRVLFLTSTRDDRVHPAHARKMAAKMQSLDQDILYYENIEGGHGGSANNRQAAYMSTLAYTFLRRELSAR